MDRDRSGLIGRLFRWPPYATARERVLRRCFVVHTALGCLLLIAVMAMGTGLLMRTVFYIIPFQVLGSLWYIPLRWAHRRALGVLRERDFRICPRCAYDLRGVDAACPECGRAFDGDELRETWTMSYRHHWARTGWSARLPGE